MVSDLMGWRWIFYLNLPVGLGLLILVMRNIGESRNEQSARLDPWGSLFFSASLLSLIWSWLTYAGIGATSTLP
jgi:predicted MFS family arabinose efflux permease